MNTCYRKTKQQLNILGNNIGSYKYIWFLIRSRYSVEVLPVEAVDDYDGVGNDHCGQTNTDQYFKVSWARVQEKSRNRGLISGAYQLPKMNGDWEMAGIP